MAGDHMAFELREFFAPWLNSTPEKCAQFLRDPRAAMEEIVGVPDDIGVMIERREDQVWFQASIPKLPVDEGEGSLLAMRQQGLRMDRCPVLKVSGREFIEGYVRILADYGIRVPEDVVVLIDSQDDGYLHFSVRLDLFYPTLAQS